MIDLQDWPTAYEVMDVPQMHVYEQFHANPVEVHRSPIPVLVVPNDEHDL